VKSQVRRPVVFKIREISNDSGVGIVNFTTPKNLIVESTMFPHCNIHKDTRTPSDGKTHNQLDHIMMDRRIHSSILVVRSFRADDFYSDYYLMVAKVRERLAVNNQRSHRFYMKSFSSKKLNEV
jgi:hypothetical protein